MRKEVKITQLHQKNTSIPGLSYAQHMTYYSNLLSRHIIESQRSNMRIRILNGSLTILIF